jgi:hypothetical protein
VFRTAIIRAFPAVEIQASLRNLDLHYNDLASLPGHITSLADLKSLNLSRNQLTSLPEELGALSNLEILSLGNNRLQSLPAEIGKLTKLTTLTIENNELITLPRQISALHDLTMLNLANNKLSTLPEEIGELKALKLLNIGGNRLTSIPASLLAIDGLKVIGASDNDLPELYLTGAPLGIMQAITTEVESQLVKGVSRTQRAGVAQAFFQLHRALNQCHHSYVRIKSQHRHAMSDEHRYAVFDLIRTMWRVRDILPIFAPSVANRLLSYCDGEMYHWMPPEMWNELRFEESNLRGLISRPIQFGDLPDVPRQRELVKMAKPCAWAWFRSWDKEPPDYQSAEIAVRRFIQRHFDLAEFVLSIEGDAFSDVLESVFISYGSPDESFARRLSNALRDNGVRVFFFPEDATPGERLHHVMRDGINQYEKMILVCSKASLTREGVMNEIEEALSREAREGGITRVSPVPYVGH